MEPLPAGARMPPSPPRPPAPPTTGWMDRAGGPPWRPPVAPRPTVVEFLRLCLRELGKVLWPDRRTVRRNATLVLLTVMTVVTGLGALELAISQLAGGLRS